MFVKRSILVGLYLQVCLVPQYSALDFVPLQEQIIKFTKLYNLVDSGISDGRSDISRIYSGKVQGLLNSFKKTVGDVQVISNEFNKYVTTEPDLLPECIEDAKKYLEAAKVMVSWVMASCQKNLWTAYHSTVEQKYRQIAPVQTEANGYLIKHLQYLKGKNVFKITDWDEVLVNFVKFYEKQESTYRNGVDFNLKDFERDLDRVNEDYGRCNDEAKTKFAEDSAYYRVACNAKMDTAEKMQHCQYCGLQSQDCSKNCR